MHKNILPDNTDPDVYIIAWIHLSPELGFEETAKRLEKVLGITLESTDEFDEYPGFVGEGGGYSISLRGIPPAEPEFHGLKPITWFSLVVRSMRRKKSHSWRVISDQLADSLTEALGIKFWGLEWTPPVEAGGR